jgi:hypothetical protein
MSRPAIPRRRTPEPELQGPSRRIIEGVLDSASWRRGGPGPFLDRRLDGNEGKVLAGERLSFEDGMVVDERITLAAGGDAGAGMARRDLEHLILETRRVPVERDTLYRTVQGPAAAPRRAAAG